MYASSKGFLVRFIISSSPQFVSSFGVLYRNKYGNRLRGAKVFRKMFMAVNEVVHGKNALHQFSLIFLII